MFTYLADHRAEIYGRVFMLYRCLLFAGLVLLTCVHLWAIGRLIFGYYSSGIVMLFGELFFEGWPLCVPAWVLLLQWLITGNRSVIPWRKWDSQG